MSAKSMYLSEYRWRRMPGSLRNLLLSIMPKSHMVGNFVCNVQSRLRDRGCPEAAADLAEEMDAQVADARGEYVYTANRKAAHEWPSG